MINFNLLKLRFNESSSFVGIKKKNEELYFYIPKGFDAQLSELNTFVGKRDLFFLLYKILGTFKQICIEKGNIDDIGKFRTQDRDGVINSQRGSEIQEDEEDSENIFYSKLDMITDFLEAYDEPKILALAYRLGRSNKFDVSQIHRYLHQAVYLPNHAAYVDEMLFPRRVMQFESTDIVTMYCYLFCEIKQQLGEAVNAEITALAEQFRQHHFGNQDSLFDEQSYEQVLDILKDALETIDHNTPIKDVDYWQYYEVINLFLYGNWHQAENGEIWGIKNFHSVWESMCLTHLVQIIDPSLLLYLDTRYLSSQTVERAKSSAKLINLSNIFKINNYSLKPDAIIFKSITHKKVWSNNSDDYTYKTIIYKYEKFFEIIDIKYFDAKYFHHPNKIEEIKRRSVRKQFVYEHLLQKTLKKRKDQYRKLNIRSSFWLPSYRPDDSELLQDDSTFMDDYIKLKKVNFKLLAETYFA